MEKRLRTVVRRRFYPAGRGGGSAPDPLLHPLRERHEIGHRQLFVRVVKASFGQRRKMLRNSLRAAFGDFGGAEHPFFSQRAEQLSVADFVALTQWVEQRIGG